VRLILHHFQPGVTLFSFDEAPTLGGWAEVGTPIDPAVMWAEAT
jgi:hypothetical protein